MMYKDILIKTVNLWLGDIIVGILPSFKNNPMMNKVNNIMGSFLGLDLSNYSILSEFSFLIPRFFGNYVNNYVNDFINMTGMSDEDIPKQFNEILRSEYNMVVEEGIFGAHMILDPVCDGPVTIELEF